MTRAFHGDAAVRDGLLARLDRHAAAGTLVFGDPVWDGTRGTPMGVAIEDDDAAAYTAAYGYPLPLAALLDPLMEGIDGAAAATAAARRWVECVTPGADLSMVPTRLVLTMLEAAGADADPVTARLLALHRRDLAGDPPPRDDWRAARTLLIDGAETDDDPVAAAARPLWEASAWPAGRGRSTVALTFAKWRHLRAMAADPGWTAADIARTRALLDGFWREKHAERATGAPIDFHALLVAADPDLAARHIAYLERSNGAYLAAGADLAARCFSFFIDASPAA